jgi:hypothetical protein
MNHLVLGAIFLAAAIGLTWMHLARLRSIKRESKRRLLTVLQRQVDDAKAVHARHMREGVSR